MKGIDLADVRAVALLGHTHSGKTTLIDSILHRLGVSDRQGSPAQGSSFCDINPEEKDHKFTIWAKPFFATYTTRDGHKSEFVLIDTPGYGEFYGNVVAATRAADAGLVVVDAAEGIQVGTNRAWRRCEERAIPRGIAITGLDKDNTSFASTVAALQEAWGPQCIPVVLPQPDLSGVISVLDSRDIPAELEAEVRELKTKVLEAVAETDDSLIEKYLGGEELTPEEFARGLHGAVNHGALVPIFATLPMREAGIEELLEGIHHLFPSPDYHEVPDEAGAAVGLDQDAPFCGFVWRTVNDPFIGHVVFVRVVGGTLRADSEIFNATRGHKERVGHLYVVNGAKQEAVREAHAGDTVAMPKLKSTYTNDSLCAAGQEIRLEPIHFPIPVMSVAVKPKLDADEEKLGAGLTRVAEEDPTLRVERNPETKELVLSGLGDIHINVSLEHMQQRNKVEVDLSPPRIAYRETITAQGEGHYRHKKQSGGRGQYGEVFLRLEPLANGDEEWFVNKIVGGVIPGNFIPAVEKGVAEALQRGVVAGYPVERVKATVYDGSYHDVDSSEIAFKIAAARAFTEGMQKARPVLLEPVMKLTIDVPDRFLGDVTGDMSQRRGRVLGMEPHQGLQRITAEAPQTEIARYAADLRSMTGGRGSFELEFVRYEQVPAHLTPKIIADSPHQHPQAED